MIGLLATFSLLLAVASVHGEPCTRNGTVSDWLKECTHEMCNQGSIIGCVGSGTKGVCTCVTRCDDDVERCHMKTQCIRTALLLRCGLCERDDHDYHCIDNHCHCGFPITHK